MSDLEKRSQKLSEAITRLQRQKADAIQEAEQLTEQITSDLIADKNVDQLLSDRQLKHALAEAIGPAVERVQRQLEEVQCDIKAEKGRQRLEQLKEERAPKQSRLDEIEKLFNTFWGPTRQQECEPLLEEREKLGWEVKILDRQIKELQDLFMYHLPEMHDQLGGIFQRSAQE